MRASSFLIYVQSTADIPSVQSLFSSFPRPTFEQRGMIELWRPLCCSLCSSLSEWGLDGSEDSRRMCLRHASFEASSTATPRALRPLEALRAQSLPPPGRPLHHPGCGAAPSPLRPLSHWLCARCRCCKTRAARVAADAEEKRFRMRVGGGFSSRRRRRRSRLPFEPADLA
eukprot:6211226-Pleurochrysis_carterae.AAC.4